MIKFIINDDSIKPFAKEWFIASILLCFCLKVNASMLLYKGGSYDVK